MAEPDKAGFLVRTTADKKAIFLQAVETNHHDVQEVFDTFMFRYVKDTLEARLENELCYSDIDYETALNQIRSIWAKRQKLDVFQKL